MANTYTYSKLDDANARILRLLPHTDKSTPIRCELVACPLLDDSVGLGAGLYEALSYVWGSPENPRQIFVTDRAPTDSTSSCNSGKLSVTANLHDALTRLRHPYVDRILWVDAICINQGDIEERNRQVASMAQIYATATRVLVWLGETGDDGAETALGELLEVAKETKVLSGYSKAIAALLQRDWFHRVWVLQEVAAARAILVMCGSGVIDGEILYLGINAIRKRWMRESKKRKILSAAMATEGKQHEAQPGLKTAIHWQLMKDTFLRSRCRHHTAPTSGPERREKTRFTLRVQPLAHLLQMVRGLEATDARDMVFALVGMADDDLEDSGLLPDYSISFEELIRRLCAFLFAGGLIIHDMGTVDQRLILLKFTGPVLGQVQSVNMESLTVEVSTTYPLSLQQKGHVVTLNPRESKWLAGVPEGALLLEALRPGDILIRTPRRQNSTYAFIRMGSDYGSIIGVTPLFQDWKTAEESAYHPKDELRTLWLVWDWAGRTSLDDSFEIFAKKHLNLSTTSPQERILRWKEIALMKWGMIPRERQVEAMALTEKIVHEYLITHGDRGDRDEITILGEVLADGWEKKELIRLWRLVKLLRRPISSGGPCPEQFIQAISAIYGPLRDVLLDASQESVDGLDNFLAAEENRGGSITRGMVKLATRHNDLGLALRNAVFTAPATYLDPGAVLFLVDRSRSDTLPRNDAHSLTKEEQTLPVTLHEAELLTAAVRAGKIRFDDEETVAALVSKVSYRQWLLLETMLAEESPEHVSRRIRVTEVVIGGFLNNSPFRSVGMMEHFLRNYEDESWRNPETTPFTSSLFAKAASLWWAEFGAVQRLYEARKALGLSSREEMQAAMLEALKERGEMILMVILEIDKQDRLGLLTRDVVRRICDSIRGSSDCVMQSKARLILKLVSVGREHLVMTEDVTGAVLHWACRLEPMETQLPLLLSKLVQLLLWREKAIMINPAQFYRWVPDKKQVREQGMKRALRIVGQTRGWQLVKDILTHASRNVGSDDGWEQGGMPGYQEWPGGVNGVKLDPGFETWISWAECCSQGRGWNLVTGADENRQRNYMYPSSDGFVP